MLEEENLDELKLLGLVKTRISEISPNVLLKPRDGSYGESFRQRLLQLCFEECLPHDWEKIDDIDFINQTDYLKLVLEKLHIKKS